MGPVLYAMLQKYWLTLIGIVLLVVTLFLPHGATRNWLILVAFLLVVVQTVLNALRGQRGGTTPGATPPDA
jgi:hypothetical protein